MISYKRRQGLFPCMLPPSPPPIKDNGWFQAWMNGATVRHSTVQPRRLCRSPEMYSFLLRMLRWKAMMTQSVSAMLQTYPAIHIQYCNMPLKKNLRKLKIAWLLEEVHIYYKYCNLNCSYLQRPLVTLLPIEHEQSSYPHVKTTLCDSRSVSQTGLHALKLHNAWSSLEVHVQKVLLNHQPHPHHPAPFSLRGDISHVTAKAAKVSALQKSTLHFTALSCHLGMELWHHFMGLRSPLPTRTGDAACLTAKPWGKKINTDGSMS